MNFKGTTREEIASEVFKAKGELLVQLIEDLADARRLVEEKTALVEVQYMKIKEQRERIGELLKINEELEK